MDCRAQFGLGARGKELCDCGRDPELGECGRWAWLGASLVMA